jgi:pectin methylesterase-like acyl-CoA thioesterase
MSIRGAYFKSCTIKGTVDFIFSSARSLDGVGLEVDSALDGANLKYIFSPLWSYSAPWPALMVNLRRSKLNYPKATSFLGMRFTSRSSWNLSVPPAEES